VTFGCIWAALAILTWDLRRRLAAVPEAVQAEIAR
jgi:hypothetical protein